MRLKLSLKAEQEVEGGKEAKFRSYKNFGVCLTSEFNSKSNMNLL